MCVILVKPSGVSLPSEQHLRACWTRNPDGAGLMYAHRGAVRIEKGFMTFEALTGALARLKRKMDLRSTPMVLHFRWSTHGDVSPANTHPFPVAGELSELTKEKTACAVGVAHNGIVRIKPRDSHVSDTMEYILAQLSVMYDLLPDFYRRARVLDLIQEQTDGSRWAFLTASGQCHTVGSFYEVDGVRYSNLHCTPQPVSSDYQKSLLMWLSAKDHCVVLGDGAFECAEGYLVDGKGRVYQYSEEYEAAVPIPQAKVRTSRKGKAFDMVEAMPMHVIRP